MGAFNDVLSRLNGNVDEVEQGKKRKAREDLGRKLYVEAKFGRMRFVRAGFLVGGEITPKESEQPLDGTGMPESELGPSLTTGKAEKKRRKEERSKKKRRKEDLGRREEHPDNIDAEADTTTITILKHDLHNEPKKQRRKAENRAQKEQRRGGARDNEKIEPFADASAVSYGREMDHETAENDKNNKRACREAKRQKKRARNQSSEHTSSAEDSSAPSTMEPCVMARQNTDAVIGTAVATQAKLSNGRGMQAVRRRYIQHKGMAGMDAEAMREVCESRSLIALSRYYMSNEGQILMVKAG